MHDIALPITNSATDQVDNSIDDSIKVHVRDLEFFYGGYKALEKINLTIPEHQVVAFIGHRKIPGHAHAP